MVVPVPQGQGVGVGFAMPVLCLSRPALTSGGVTRMLARGEFNPSTQRLGSA